MVVQNSMRERAIKVDLIKLQYRQFYFIHILHQKYIKH